MRIFIGYDEREAVAYHVLAHSIIARASIPVTITPLALRALGYVYSRPRHPQQTTDFAFTRFLVPYLCGYEGMALYLDCDMLCRVDVDQLRGAINYDKAVWVCQHDYTPRPGPKMDGQPNLAYPRKNWSSLMLFNTARCRALTPEYVSTASPADLHRFAWLDDAEIGALDRAWNWLVGEYPPNPLAKILHYTLGGPWFEACRDGDHADDWRAEWAEMQAPLPAVLTSLEV